MSWSTKDWTTLDEVLFLRGVGANGNRRALENYISLAGMRTWPAMVSQARVIEVAREELARTRGEATDAR